MESGEGEASNKKEKWYPGKFVGKAMRRASAASSTSNQENSGPASVAPMTGTFPEHTRKIPQKSGSILVSSTSPDIFTASRNSDGGKEAISSQDYNRIVVGKVRLTIFEIRYLSIKNAKLTIEVGDTSAVFTASDMSFPFEREFEILDICGDIRLEFRSNIAGSPTGIIFLPLTSLVKFLGTPAPPKACWREVYPSYERSLLGESRRMLKFRSAWAELPGSGLAKPIVSLGFVNMQAEILLPRGKTNVLAMYFVPSPPLRFLDRTTVKFWCIVAPFFHRAFTN